MPILLLDNKFVASAGRRCYTAVHMSNQRKTIEKMADWVRKEYATYEPKERERKIRKVLGNGKSARSFVKRLMPELYDEVYGQANSSASVDSVSARIPPLHAKSR